MGKKKEFGPITSGRSCHDILWLLVFLCFIAGMAVVTYFAVTTGNINRLEYARDTLGNLCGSSIGTDSTTDLSNRTKLYYFNLTYSNSYKMCVNACPTVDFGTLCKYNETASSDPVTLAQQFQNGTCTLTIASTSVLNRCVPNVLLNGGNSSVYAALGSSGNTTTWGVNLNTEYNSISTAAKIYQDFYESWWIVLICCGVAVVLSATWLLLAQCLGGVIVWITLFGSLITTLGSTGFLWYNYYRVYIVGQDSISSGIGIIDSQVYNENILLALAIVSSVLATFLVFIVCFCHGRIKLSLKIIDHASRAMRKVPTMVLVSFVQYLVILGLCCYIGYIYALLASSGTIISSELTYGINNVTQTTTGITIQITNYQYLQIYELFGFFWIYNWVQGIAQVTVAGAVAHWYWTRDKNRLGHFVVLRSFYRTVRYHLGSIAFGSLLIAIVQIFRFLLSQIQKQLYAAKNTLTTVLLCCCQCALWILEKILKMITSKAYIEIAVYGSSFCSACHRVFALVARNAFRLVVIDGVSGFLMFLGKITITTITVIVGTALLEYYRSSFETTSSWAVFLVMIGLFSWIIATGFMAVFDITIDTIFVSFCEDVEHNDGSPDKPYYMSESLMEYMNKTNISASEDAVRKHRQISP